MNETLREQGRRIGAGWVSDKATSLGQVRNLGRSLLASGPDAERMRPIDLDHYIGVMLNGQNHGVAIGLYEAITGESAGSWRDAGLREFWDHHIGEGEWESIIEESEFGAGFVEVCCELMLDRLAKAEAKKNKSDD